MGRRIGLVLLGFVLAFVVLAVGGYLFIATGHMPMATSAGALPFEETVANMALHASVKDSLDLKSPLPVNDDTLIGGAKVYDGNCAMCHGAFRQPKPDLAKSMFPPPPQLLGDDLMTKDPEGELYWKITNGIRMTGMPAFEKILDENRRWQVTQLLKHADTLPPAVQKQLLGTE
jgi:mono/diheme cytochrome c family protein